MLTKHDREQLAVEFARYLRSQKVRLDLKTTDLAEALGVSVYAVQSWLLKPSSAGHRFPPAIVRSAVRSVLENRMPKDGPESPPDA